MVRSRVLVAVVVAVGVAVALLSFGGLDSTVLARQETSVSEGAPARGSMRASREPLPADERRLGWIGDGAWARCASEKTEALLGFYAKSSEARSLFQGCQSSIPLERRAALQKDAPSLIIAGTQKGGTTSVEGMMGKQIKSICRPLPSKVGKGDSTFWMNLNWKMEPPAEHVVRSNYLNIWHPKCRFKVQKTSDLLQTPWAPLRICQTLGRQRLVVLLRDPVKRAWSGYRQTSTHALGFQSFGNVVGTPYFFDMYARIEIALVKECPNTLPSGNMPVDMGNHVIFVECCHAVAKRFVSEPWPACTCAAEKGQGGEVCTRYYNVIRRGIYVHWLRIWLRHIPVEDLVVFRSEDFFAQSVKVVSEIACFARGGDFSPLKLRAIHFNSKTSIAPEPMWNSTARLLHEFYTPYNQELEKLLGRKLDWS